MQNASKERKAVIVRVFGGVGNQLFIYAAARRLALANNAELIIDNITGFEKDEVYRRHYQLDNFNVAGRKATAAERLEPFPHLRYSLARMASRYIPYDNRSFIRERSFLIDERLLSLRIKGQVRLEGYWQNHRYFEDIENIIRQDLRINSPSDQRNIEVAREIDHCEAVCIHIRHFDPSGSGSITNLAVNYYRRATELIEKLVDEPHYFVFSDNPAGASELLGLKDHRLTIVDHNSGDNNACFDLWLMQQCKHFIIANSTFSWWAAWLGSSLRKVVIAPLVHRKEDEHNIWNPDGELPVDWIRV